MKVALIINKNKEKAISTAIKIVEILVDANVEISSQYDNKGLLGENNISYESDVHTMIRLADFAIIAGGDGMIIHYAKLCALQDKPFIGVNMGRVGFIANMEANELEQLNDIINFYDTKKNKNFVCEEKRMMLEIKFSEDPSKTYALNEVSITRATGSKMIDLSVSLNNKETCDYRGDGLIVATPTGSTAYSLSAGGPVVSTSLRCMLLTPICAYSLMERSVLFDAGDVLTICNSGFRENEAYISIDGQSPTVLKRNDKITIKAAGMSASFIKLKDNNLYSALKNKLCKNI